MSNISHSKAILANERVVLFGLDKQANFKEMFDKNISIGKEIVEKYH